MPITKSRVPRRTRAATWVGREARVSGRSAVCVAAEIPNRNTKHFLRVVNFERPAPLWQVSKSRLPVSIWKPPPTRGWAFHLLL